MNSRKQPSGTRSKVSQKPSPQAKSSAAKSGSKKIASPEVISDQYIARRVAEWRDAGIKRVKLALTDIDGVMRGKYLSLDKFASVAKSGGAFCDCVLGWDVEDKLYDNVKFTGWHTAFPDAPFRLDLSTERRLADEGNIPFFLGEFTDAKTGGRHPLCPRGLLQRVLDRAKAMGYGAKIGFEYEFFVFDETPHTVREKRYKDLKPLTPGNFGYSVLRNSAESDIFTGLMEYHDSLGCAIEGLHCETGPGVIEAALAPDEALRGADKAAVFKTFTKVYFQKRQKMATFMAKWSLDYPGQSGHMHQSLFDLKSGDPVFHKQGGREGMSPIMESYVAGMQKFLKPFLCLCAPTVNSYTRLVKGAWAPTSATWGVENRTTALRVIPGGPKTQRMEFRLGAADGNPYLVAAACIGAGLLGIEKKLKLGEAVKGSAYEVQDSLPDELKLPSNLRDSLRNLRASKEAADLFGADFVDHFANSREWEVREHEKAITDWQLARYFEII